MERTIGPMEPQRDQPAENATKARGWPCGEPPTSGYPGDKCLRDALEQLRPWSDECAVTAALQVWWDDHYARPIRGDLADVAADLKTIGTATELPDAESAAGMTAFMMVNVFKGRKTRDYDMLREAIKGIPASTARDYRRRYGDAALSEFLRHIQYEQDLGGADARRPEATCGAALPGAAASHASNDDLPGSSGPSSSLRSATRPPYGAGRKRSVHDRLTQRGCPHATAQQRSGHRGHPVEGRRFGQLVAGAATPDR